MTIKTIPVGVTATAPDNSPAAGASFSAQLVDVSGVVAAYGTDGDLVVPSLVTGTLDDSGAGVMRLWPNERGSNPTLYRVRVSSGEVALMDVTIAVPDVDPDIEVPIGQLINQQPWPAVDAAQQALIALQAGQALLTQQVAEGQQAITQQVSAGQGSIAAQVTAGQTAIGDQVTAAEQSIATQVQHVDQVAVAVDEDREAIQQLSEATAEAKQAAEEAASQAQTSQQAAADDKTVTSGLVSEALALLGGIGSISTALAIQLGYLNDANAAASLARSYAAAAGTVAQQDLSGVTAQALYRSPNAITAFMIYDPSREPSGGAWIDQCAHTSWQREALNGVWLGALASEAAARAVSGATTGDYFQRISDGKFYKLNAGAGITEVYRGNKAKFPRLAAFVAEINRLTIFDLTEPGRPMWMVLTVSSTSAIFGGNLGCIFMLQGELVASGFNCPPVRINFPADRVRRYGSNQSAATWAGRGLAERNGAAWVNGSPLGTLLTNASGASISMCVMPDAPVDPLTGLQVPTIAIATASRLAIIHADGSVVTSSNSSSFTHVSITPYMLWAGTGGTTLLYALRPGALGASFALVSSNGNTAGALANAANMGAVICGGPRGALGARNSGTPRISFARFNEGAIGNGMVAQITNDHSTGWMVGDTRRVWLSDVATGLAGATEADRSYKNKPLTVNGSIAKTAVAAAAQLAAYSGFSAANYLREAYSADLDFGTGAWSMSAWVNIPTTLPASAFPAGSAIDLSAGWVNNGCDDFATSGGTQLTAAKTIAGGSDVANIGSFAVTSGKSYRFAAQVSALSGAANQWAFAILQGTTFRSNGISVPATGLITGVLTATATGTYSLGVATTTIAGITIDSVTLEEITAPAVIFDRSSAGGQRITLGISGSGQLQATAYDGTTTRTVTTTGVATGTYNTATWLKAEVTYTGGTLAILVNGVPVVNATGAALLTLSNASAVATVGNSFALDAPFPGSIALVKLSATVPTAEQAAFAFDQERGMFTAGAQIMLPDAGNVVDMDYDPNLGKWCVASAANDCEFSGLVRTASTAVSAGSISKVAAAAGAKLIARTTTNPGVDVTLPAQNLKAELQRRAEDAARMARLTHRIDFDLTTGVTDVAAPAGWEFQGLTVAGTEQRESPLGLTTKLWSRRFDGFVETAFFHTAPGNVWVQGELRRMA